MDRNSWVFQLSPEEIARTVRVLSGKPGCPHARVTRRGWGMRPWIILLDGEVQTDRLGRPRRFKTRQAAMARIAKLKRTATPRLTLVRE